MIPGLVNTHAHATMRLLRSYADDMPLMCWLNDYIWPAEGRCWINADEYITEGLEAYEECSGHTLIKGVLAPHALYTVSDKSLERLHTLSDEMN